MFSHRCSLLILSLVALALASVRAETPPPPWNVQGMLGREIGQASEDLIARVEREGTKALPDAVTLARLVEGLRIRPVELPEERLEKARTRMLDLFRAEMARADLTVLAQMVVNSSDSAVGKYVLPAMQLRMMETEVERIVSNPSRRLVLAGALAPGRPFGWWQEVSNEATRQQQLVAAYREWAKAFPLKSVSQDEVADSTHYQAAAQAVLLNRREKVAGTLLEFNRGGWCGTCAIQFERSKMVLVFMALLQEGRITEAAGASFLVPDAPEWLRPPGQASDPWRIKLMKFYGLSVQGNPQASWPE